MKDSPKFSGKVRLRLLVIVALTVLAVAALAATVPDVIGTMPLKAYGDFIYNWEAPDDASHGFQTGVRLGNPKEAGDWAAGLLYEYIERDAVLMKLKSQ